jgi:hypothetical protein
MGEPLFDSRVRSDVAYKKAYETTYDFLDRIARPELAAPRTFLNEWFEHWPEDDREELRSRLVSKDLSNFDGAFWELYLHEVHRRLGFEVERDPKVEGTNKVPDFRMSGPLGTFYLEATVSGDASETKVRQRGEAHVADLINEAFNPDFQLRLEGVAMGENQPPRDAVVRAVEGWMATLDWETERRRFDAREKADPTKLEVAGTHIFVSPWPRTEAARGDKGRTTVVTQPIRGGVVNDPPQILDDLKKKGGKFKKLSDPYLVAVLCLRDFTSELDIEHALYGPEVVHIQVGPDAELGDAKVDRDPRGLWQFGNARRGTRVAAVLSSIRLNPWSVGSTSLTLWTCPWVAQPLEADLPWDRVDPDLESNRLVRVKGSLDPAVLLGIPK